MNIHELTEQRENATLNRYASFSSKTKGREKDEEPCTMRTDYQRDRDRILHCNSFRRLMHKTQVFFLPVGDHYRTRLTHTLEVNQVARTIARALGLNEDLTEAIALGHDLGHTPFGHTGEAVLDSLSPHGYKHSTQSVRVVEVLEHNGGGLNLTWETRNGIECHSSGTPAETLEGQLVRYADKIAYMNHDIEDAISAGIITEDDIPMDIKIHLGRTKSQRLTSMITNLVDANVNSSEIKMDAEGKKYYDMLRSFMFEVVYVSQVAKAEEEKVKAIINQLYQYYYKNPDKLPETYREIHKQTEDVDIAVCDYISGMSDRFCIIQYENLFIPKPFEIL